MSKIRNQHSPDQFLTGFGNLLDTHFDELSSQTHQTGSASPAGRFGRYIRAARCQRNLTPLELACELQQEEAYIYAVEPGMIPADQIDGTFLERLASFLDEEITFFALLLAYSIAPTQSISQDQGYLHKFSPKIEHQLAKAKSKLQSLEFVSFQFNPFHFAPGLVVTAVLCLFLISQDTFQPSMTFPQIPTTPTAMRTDQPSARYPARYHALGDFFCAAIQPEPSQGNTQPFLVCDPELQLRLYQSKPAPRGGYHEGI